ncbi:TolC family protein [bacterium]|nr:TolC family protein [bacterium]
MSPISRPVCVIIGILVGLSIAHPTWGLTLEEFIDQVKEKNKAVQVSLKTINALTLKISEKDGPTTPRFSTSYSFLSDKKIGTFSSFLGTDSTLQTADAMVQTQLDSGLTLSGGYTLNSTEYPNSTLGGSTKAFSTATPYVGVTMPLWRNSGGDITKAAKSGTEESYLAAIKLNEFAIDAGLSQAEATYWRVALAREAVELATESVIRAKKMVNWAQSRHQLALGDDADLLQVQTLYEHRQLELKMAQQELETAERAFNALRNADPNATVGPLKSVSDVQISKFKWPKNGERKDVESAYHTLKATQAKTKVDIQNLEPALDLIGQLKLNQYAPDIVGAIQRTTATDYPTAYVGITFSGALDINNATLDNIRKGNRELIEVAELTYEQKKTDAANQWVDLSQRFLHAQKRLELVQRVENLQKQKWQSESNLHQKGRSTLLQVLNAEEDYANTRLAHLRMKGDLLGLYAQRKLFGSN